MRHHICRKEVSPLGSQYLRTQGPAPTCRCDIEGRRENQGLRGNDDGNRDEGGNGHEKKDGNGHEDRDGGENRSGNEGENRKYDGEEREPENLQSRVVKVDWKMREGRRPQRITSSNIRKTR